MEKETHHDTKPQKQPPETPRQRLIRYCQQYLAEAWTLSPCEIIKHPDDPKRKKCLFFKDKAGGRITLHKDDDLDRVLPPRTNAILARSAQKAVIDVDRLWEVQKDFPQPYRVVKSGKGHHLYFYAGDFSESKDLAFGECQLNGRGVFIPGSYHAPSGKFYEIIQERDCKDKLLFRHIKPWLVSDAESWQEGHRNNTLFKKIARDIEKNQGRNIPHIIEQAQKAGLSKEETIRTAQSAAKKATFGDHGIDPGPPPPGKDSGQQSQQKEPTQEDMKNHLNKLKEDLLSKRDPDRIVPPAFHDKFETKPKNNMVLISGQTESGKTAHCLREIARYLKQGIPCAIWEHSETNAENRLNQWIADNKLKGTPLFMSPSRRKILDQFRPGVVVLIDDTDSFFQIQRATDRREVADTLEDISWICQLLKFTLFACHYQTKTSRTEKSAIARAGGDMTWINKSRYALLIEKAAKNIEIETIGNELGEERTEAKTEERSFLKVQKGNRTPKKPTSWWLRDDYSIGEVIKPADYQAIITEKVEGQDTFLGEVAKLIEELMTEAGEDRIPTKTFLEACFNQWGVKRSQAYDYLARLKQYSTKPQKPGIWKRGFIYKL